MICSILKSFLFLQTVFYELGSYFCLMTNFGFVFCVSGDSHNPVPKKLYIHFCVLDALDSESVMVFLRPVFN
jgi:hypothetical protein